jgi:diacylglycerol O-acyltransferase / wax synthase
VLPLEPPAGESRLLLACEQLRARRLDPSRPLWEMWFLPGLPDGHVGLFMKLHHAIADGVAGVAALGAFVDLVPDPPRTSAPPWTPAPMPSRRALLADNLRQRLRELRRAFTGLDHPVETVRRARRGWPALREVFTEAPAPSTSVNRRVGWHRRFALVRSDLDLVKQIAHAYGGKVNDVLMAVLAGGLRELLLDRGERVDGLVLRVIVPVSLHTERPGQARGNLDGAMVVPLPVGEADDARRLELIAAETAERKRQHHPQSGMVFRSIPIQRAFLRLAPYQHAINTYAANVPGPPVPLYFAGAPGAGGVPGGPPPGQHRRRRRRAVVRRPVQPDRGGRPGRLPRPGGVRPGDAPLPGRAGAGGGRAGRRPARGTRPVMTGRPGVPPGVHLADVRPLLVQQPAGKLADLRAGAVA